MYAPCVSTFNGADIVLNNKVNAVKGNTGLRTRDVHFTQNWRKILASYLCKILVRFLFIINRNVHSIC